MTSLDVLHIGVPSRGWSPIDRFADLTADIFDGAYSNYSPASAGLVRKLTAPLMGCGNNRDRGLLVIARTPSQLRADVLPQGVFRSYGFAVAYVIDSFRRREIPSRWRIGPYDLIAVTRPNDEDVYARKTGRPILALPWGADVLNHGSASDDRPFDVRRLGRQPDAWDDDEATEAACKAVGLTFCGRTERLDDSLENHAALMRSLAQAKFVVASSNLVSPADYTHPTEEYLTARWTDALAAGATVAGIPPNTDESINMLWPEALIEFDELDLSANLQELSRAKAAWSPALALKNHREALARLDWRLRLGTLADRLSISSTKLDRSLDAIQSRIKALDATRTDRPVQRELV